MQASKNTFFTEHLWTTTSGVKVFWKKGFFKNFVNVAVKHLWWSLFNKIAVQKPIFWRTFANYCFCTALASLAVPYQFYFIFSTFFLIITATAVDICFFLVQIQKASENLNLISHFHWSHFHWCCFIFSFFFFLSFSVLFHFFLSLLIKRILLSWELMKMFLPTLTSLKHVHVNK